MALGLFAGASAEATSKQLLELRRQRLAEEQAQRQYELQQRQLQIQEQQLDWQKESQRLYEQFQLGVIDRQERERFGLKTIELMQQTPDPQGRLRMWQALDSIGSPYTGLAEGLLSDSIINDPQQALGYLQSLANAEPGQGFDVNVTRVYAQAAARFMGLSGQQADEFVQSYVDLASDLNAGKETIDQAKVDAVLLANQDLAADIELKQTQAAKLTQEMDHADQRLAMELEMFPILKDQALAMRDRYRAEATQAELIAGNMPYQLQLENRLLWEQIRGEENRNDLFEATFDYQVSIMESEAGIKKEEARHLLATAHIRDALAQGDLDRVQATVDLLKAQTATEQAQAAHLGVQDEATRIANRNALIGSVLELVKTGGGAMVEQFAPQLLEGLVSPDLLPSLIDDLKRIADLRLDADLKVVEASTRVALAEADTAEADALVAGRTVDARVSIAQDQARQSSVAADVAEQTAPFAVQQAQAEAQEATQRARIAGAQADVAEATVGAEIASRQAQADLLTMQAATYMEDRERAWQVQQHNMLMDEQRTEAYVSETQAAAAARGAPVAVSRDEILESAERGTGYKVSKLGEQRMELAELERDIAMLRTAVDAGDMQTIMGIQNKYGLIGADPDSLLTGLELEYETKSQMVVNGYQAIIDWGLMYGHEFVPQELGLPDDDPMFWSAVERYPFIRARNQAVSEQLDAVDHDVDMTIDDAVKAMTADAFMFADSVDVNGVTMAGARATYDKLVDEHGAEALAAVGIRGPEDLWARFQQRQAEYETHAQSLAILGNRFGVDISSRAGRDQLRQGLQTLSETLDMVEDRLMVAAQTPAGVSTNEQRSLYDQLSSLFNAYSGRVPGDIYNPFTGELNYQAALQAVRGARAAIQQDITTIWYINTRH